MSKRAGRIAALSVLFALAACGGGGGDSGGGNPPPPPASAEGAYAGTLTGSAYTAQNMVVLENGEFWSMYGNESANILYVAGFIHGSGASNNGSYASSDARDYSLSGTLNATVAATYVAGTSAQGTITYPGLGSINFSGTTAAVLPYNYNTAATAAQIAGSWNFTALDNSVGVATIGGDGAFTMVSGGCVSTGTIRPRASGKNVYDVTLHVGTSGCLTPGITATGIGIYSPIENSSLHQLIVATVSADKALGSIVFGAR